MTELPLPLPIPAPVPISPVGRAELLAVLKGVEPNWYRARDLLPRYNAWAEQNGREPITTKTLGEALQRVLGVERLNSHGHVAIWNITADLTS